MISSEDATEYSLDAAIEALDATATELGSGDPVVQHDNDYRTLSLALIGRQREALLELRDEQRIDDIVLRRLQARLDQEEIRFLGANPPE